MKIFLPPLMNECLDHWREIKDYFKNVGIDLSEQTDENLTTLKRDVIGKQNITGIQILVHNAHLQLGKWLCVTVCECCTYDIMKEFLPVTTFTLFHILVGISKRDDDDPEIVEYFLKKHDEIDGNDSGFTIESVNKLYMKTGKTRTVILMIDYCLKYTQSSLFVEKYVINAINYNDLKVFEFAIQQKEIKPEYYLSEICDKNQFVEIVLKCCKNGTLSLDSAILRSFYDSCNNPNIKSLFHQNGIEI